MLTLKTLTAIAMTCFVVSVDTLALLSSPARSAPTETVQSLFLDIPSDLLGFFEADGKIASTESMKRRVKLKDLKNGYLEVDAKGLEALGSHIQVALFKLGRTRKAIAIAYQSGDSTDDLRFFEKMAGTWTDVTKAVFPMPDAKLVNSRTRERVPEAAKKHLNLGDCASGTFQFVLPRSGRTIIGKTASDCLTTGNGKTIFEYALRDERFVLLP